MIRFLGKEQIPQLCRVCSGDPFGCRIASLALAYGADSGFAEFWLQTTESGQACGAVSRLNGAVTVQISSAADQEELEEFLSHIGYGTALWESSLRESAGEVMEWAGKGVAARIAGEFFFSEAPALSQVYDLLKQCEDESFRVPEFDAFYVDTSHRLRHQTARLAALEHKGRLLACGFSLWETPDSAVLGAIAVTPQSRGRGLGSAVVLHLLEQLEGKRVYLFRSNGKNEKFYQRLGFTHRTYFKEGTGTDVRIFSHRS